MRQPPHGNHRHVEGSEDEIPPLQRVRRALRVTGVRNARARVGELSFRSDIRASAFVRRRHRRRRCRRPGHRDLHAPVQSLPFGRPARRRTRARREDPGQRRIALQRDQRHRHRARFLGRQAVDDSPRAARLSRQRHDRVLPRNRRVAPRGSGRQAVSGYQPRARRARSRCCARATRSARSSPRDIACSMSNRSSGGFRVVTDRGETPRVGRRPGDRRPVAAEERQRRRRLCDREPPGPHDRADHAGARPAGPGRDRPVHARVSGVSQDVELAVWIDGAIAVRATGSMLWTHFGISGPVALNVSRHWLRARVEGRPSRSPRTSGPAPGSTTSTRTGSGGRSRTRNPRCKPRSSSILPASVAAAILRQLALDGTATLAHLARDDRRRLVARPRRIPAAGHRLARIHLRRSHRRRRRAHRNRRGDDGVAGVRRPLLRRRNPRRRRTDWRLQFSMGLVERVRRRPGAGLDLTPAMSESYAQRDAPALSVPGIQIVA